MSSNQHEPQNHRLAWLPPALGNALALFSGQGARAGYLAAIDQGVISLANFLATLILARTENLTELGVYSVGFTSLRLVRAFQEALTIQPVNAFGAAMDESEFKRYAASTSLIQILLAVVASAGVALLGWTLTQMGNDTLGPGVFALWPAYLFWQLHEYVRRLLYARGRVAGAVLNTALANAARLGLMAWWFSARKLSGAAALNAIALGSLIALLPGLWQTRRFWSKDYESLGATWKRNWDFGRWLLGGTIANWISVEFYPVLAAGMISFAAAGAYRALQNLVAPIHMLLRALDTFLTPRAAKAYQEHGLPALQRQLRLAYLVSGVPTLGLLSIAILFPEFLLRLLYGAENYQTFQPFQDGILLMALFYGLWGAYWPLQTAFKAVRLSRPIFLANLVAIVLMFTLGVWMIQAWGLYGTIGGQALNALVVSLVLWTTWGIVQRKGAV